MPHDQAAFEKSYRAGYLRERRLTLWQAVDRDLARVIELAAHLEPDEQRAFAQMMLRQLVDAPFGMEVFVESAGASNAKWN